MTRHWSPHPSSDWRGIILNGVASFLTPESVQTACTQAAIAMGEQAGVMPTVAGNGVLIIRYVCVAGHLHSVMLAPVRAHELDRTRAFITDALMRLLERAAAEDIESNPPLVAVMQRHGLTIETCRPQPTDIVVFAQI